MDEIAASFQRLVAVNELLTYAVVGIWITVFLSLIITAIGFYHARIEQRRAKEAHRRTMEIMQEMRRTADRSNYYLFRKLGPVELP